MPENTQFAFLQLAGLVSFDCLIDPQILVVTGQDLGDAATRVVKQNKVLEQIQKVFLFTDAAQHSFKRDTSLLVFV